MILGVVDYVIDSAFFSQEYQCLKKASTLKMNRY